VSSPALEEGDELALDSSSLLVGRGSRNDVDLTGDEYASSEHVRIEPRRDGVWLEDVGSTNGTYLNGIQLTSAKRLTPGDVVRIGETELRYES
jgi:pSer/pThr/pTyr-binding forkhead associated (FHA) protein